MIDNQIIQKKRRKALLIILIVVVFLSAVTSLPPVWSRVSYHSRELYRTVKYWLKPPNQAIFIPSTLDETQVATSVADANTGNTLLSPPATQLTAVPTNNFSETPIDLIPTQTLAPVSLPSSVLLRGISCERQDMNNCGPATLSMYLSYYDWGKDQYAAAAVLKPNGKDVNVMPYEVVDFVNEHTALHALWRYGGDLETIKALLNAGFPVMIEKSFEPFTLRNEGWMGHYNLVVGYDDEKQILTVHDSYLMSHTPWGAEIPKELWDSFIGFDFSYSELEQAWRSFNFVFVVVYPPERENDVQTALGRLATDEGAYQIAYDRAIKETSSLTAVRDKFFAWFNAGTSLVSLQNYSAAATAFDTAFGIYPDIIEKSRPYRILWYETGPYAAYYYSERYQDVIALTNQTLGLLAEPVLEESYYWRAMSYYALGDTTRALSDLRTSLIYHPGFAPSKAILEKIEKTP